MMLPPSPNSSDPPLQDDKVHSDFIADDNVSYQQIGSFSGVAIGRGVQDSMAQTSPGALQSETLSALFIDVYHQIQVAPPDQDQAELRSMVKRIEYEVYKGSAASSARLERMLRSLHSQAPLLSQYLTERLSQLDLSPAINKALSIGGEDESAPVAPPTPEAVVRQEIQAARLDPAAQDQLLGCVSAIQEEIQKETQTKGGWVDVRRVQNALGDLQRAARSLPGLRTRLWEWLVESEGVPTSVRILAKKLIF